MSQSNAAGGNQLADAVSPYLLQHKDNPVHWREWGEAAFAEARDRDRPILLSIGYAACHWCHVMAHESFEDAAVAEIMNALFVNVKVDREERPDVDQFYMTALHAFGEQGGWPMTMVLTPEGKPFFGGTYFPKEPRYGRPGFVQIMQALDRAWTERRAEIDKSAEDIGVRLRTHLQTHAAPGELDHLALEPVAARIGTMMDKVRGGMGTAPKFPNAPYMEVLARSGFHHGNEEHKAAFLKTTRALCLGGIYDHIGGGLARYSTDERWLVPHFEKMLYDNAQFLRHLTWCWRATGEDLFRRRIAETVGFLDREMRTAGGGLAASLDADSADAAGHMEEGAFYVWQRAEIDAALGPRAAAFAKAYDVSEGGNWEGHSIPHRLHGGAEGSDADFDEDKAALLTLRERRARPGRDDKILADWNGLAIRALAEIHQATGEETALRLGREAFAFVMGEMVVDGRLRHAARDGRTAGLALSSDYGAMISAAMALFATTLDPALLSHAEWLADELERWHADGEGGHFLNASDASDVPARLRGDQDDAMPSGTSLVLEGLLLLAQVTGRIDLSERAERAVLLAAGRAGAAPSGVPGIVSAAERLTRGSELALFGWRSNPGWNGMVDIVARTVDLDRLDFVTHDPAMLPQSNPMSESHPSRTPAAFHCTGRVCRAPVFTPEALQGLLLPV
ncbi:thioredoxin domain-containing protein [Fulvimarina sp. 2208YS6-2-32]|uniref:Thioredoxin domain-containing protein n=1 Tax=Fulvimarina uroteuthidis TaxID=3098149 RepID=A0ABU5I146_9HYPH|nr:thioredoxin domain-containing protein [Fulvimarina sp. 2208YS6-2-32]MDY8109099.1 thioredoxin domain-containing protein [Fulvimarina sp. 2208YS6-2-32]